MSFDANQPAYVPFTAFTPSTSVGPYRAEDFWALPEGAPVELLRGRLVLSPSPTPLRQTILFHLGEILQRIADSSGGLMLIAPMDILLSEDTIPQPDALYLSAERHGLVTTHIEGAPDLVVEILSPSSVHRDRVEKMSIYAEYAVPEYWIVDPDSHVIEFFTNVDGTWQVATAKNNRYESPRLPELQLDLEAFWQVVENRLS